MLCWIVHLSPILLGILSLHRTVLCFGIHGYPYLRRVMPIHTVSFPSIFSQHSPTSPTPFPFLSPLSNHAPCLSYSQHGASLQATPTLEGSTAAGVAVGAYVLSESGVRAGPPHLVLVSTGTEVALAVAVAKVRL